MSRPPSKILAVSSGGGHWIQLARILPGLEGHRLFVATVDARRRAEIRCERFFTVGDASRWNKLGLLVTALQILWILIRVRPRVVLSTGAAPGFLALFLGKCLGARTAWIDSLANAERLSLSGEKAGRFADLWLTQWPHLARPEGPFYRGRVL